MLRVAEQEGGLVRNFDEGEAGACVHGDQHCRDGQDAQFVSSKL